MNDNEANKSALPTIPETTSVWIGWTENSTAARNDVLQLSLANMSPKSSNKELIRTCRSMFVDFIQKGFPEPIKC